MKKFWNLFLAAIILCGTAAVLTACGGDDDDNTQPKGATFQKVRVIYSMVVSSPILSEFRVNSYFTDSNGSQMETVEKANWEKTVEFDASKMPKTFEMYYALAPKNREPGATATAQGEALIKYVMQVMIINSDGTIATSREVHDAYMHDAFSSNTVLAEFAKGYSGPVLAIAGTEDTTVDPEWSNKIVAANGNEASATYFIEGMDHTFNVFAEEDFASIKDATDATGAFFAETLK